MSVSNDGLIFVCFISIWLIAKVAKPAIILSWKKRYVMPRFSFWNCSASLWMNSFSPISSSLLQLNLDRSCCSFRISNRSSSAFMYFEVDMLKSSLIEFAFKSLAFTVFVVLLL